MTFRLSLVSIALGCALSHPSFAQQNEVVDLLWQTIQVARIGTMHISTRKNQGRLTLFNHSKSLSFLF